MSDNWINLVPFDPHFVPSDPDQHRAREYFWSIAPESDEIELIVDELVQFRDCGANHVSTHWPKCKSALPNEWWSSRMDDDYRSGGFVLEQYELPCCHGLLALNELEYSWPQAFSKFALEAMNPSIGRLPGVAHAEFEEILGTSLMVVYQHI